MKDIYIVIKDIDTSLTILSAGFDEDEAILKAGFEPDKFADGYIDIIERSACGRVALMTLEAGKYKGVLTREDVMSVLELGNKVEATDCDGDVFDVLISKVMNKLPDSSDKAEWITELGLDNDNDSADMFNIDDMIVNKA